MNEQAPSVHPAYSSPPPKLRRRYQVHTTAFSTASPDEVWQLLADVTTWTDWAGFDEAHYEKEGAPSRHGVGAVRRFRIGLLSSREHVLSFEPARQLSYDYDGSLPLAAYRGDVQLSRHRGGTRIVWRAEFAAGWPLTGPLLRRGMTKVLGTIAVRLALAAEGSARPHGAS
jgi:Polyketide cyclase / dehydrase and lipid transport